MASNQGEVDIELGGETVTLRSTLGAAKRINFSFGNLVEAYTRVQKFDIEAYSMVIAGALEKPIKTVEEQVFLSSYDKLRDPLTKYLTLLSNGGREPPVPADAAESDALGNA